MGRRCPTSCSGYTDNSFSVSCLGGLSSETVFSHVTRCNKCTLRSAHSEAVKSTPNLISSGINFGSAAPADSVQKLEHDAPYIRVALSEPVEYEAFAQGLRDTKMFISPLGCVFCCCDGGE